jgi:hypothetical protein
MTVKNGGNVGIGTTSPSDFAALTLVKNGASNYSAVACGNSNSTATLFVGVGGSSVANTALRNNAYLLNASNSDLIFGTNDTERMRITSGGNVGIGTSSPAERLHVETSNEYQITYARTSIGKRWALGIDTGGTYFNNRTDSVLPLYITNAGNVLIGTTTDFGQKVCISAGNTSESSAHLNLVNSGIYSGFHFLDGTAYYIGQNSNFRSLRMYSGGSTGTGVNLAAGSTSWGTYSDERLKTDLLPILNATEKVSQLRSVTGRYKTDDEKKRRAFLIAQDVKEVLPEAIGEDLNSGILEIRYSEIIPLLVASIKELKQEIDTLKN